MNKIKLFFILISSFLGLFGSFILFQNNALASTSYTYSTGLDNNFNLPNSLILSNITIYMLAQGDSQIGSGYLNIYDSNNNLVDSLFFDNTNTYHLNWSFYTPINFAINNQTFPAGIYHWSFNQTYQTCSNGTWLIQTGHFILTAIPTATTVNITYPTNNTSGIPQFSDFEGSYTTATTSRLEIIKIVLGTTPTNSVATSTANIVIENGTANYFAKNNYLLQPNKAYYATPYIFDYNTGELLYTGTQITFGTSATLLPYEKYTGYTPPVNTLTYPTLSTNFTGFATSSCPAFELFASTTVDTLFCVASNFLANSANTGMAMASSSLNYIGQTAMNTFPLSGVYIINDSIKNAYVATSSTDIILNGIGSHSNIALWQNKNLTLLSANTLDNFSTNIGFNIKNFIDNVLYAITGLIILFLSISVIKSLNHSNSSDDHYTIK